MRHSIFMFFAFWKNLSTYLFHKCLFQNFFNYTPSKSLLTIKLLTTSRESLCRHTLGHFLFQSKYINVCNAQSYVHTENFPSPVSCRVVLVRHSSIAGVHFWMMSAYYTEPSINQALNYSSSAAYHRTLLIRQ